MSEDGTRIVTGSSDTDPEGLGWKTGQQLLDLKGHTDQVRSVAMSVDRDTHCYRISRQDRKVWMPNRTTTPRP